MNIKSDSVFKVVLFLFLGMIVLQILLSYANITDCGQVGFGIHLSSNYLDVNWFDPVTWNLHSVLLMLFRIFCILFFIGLTVGLLVLIRDYVFDHGANGKKNTTSIPASEIPTTNNQTVCAICGKSIGTDWRVCAFCGEELNSLS